MSGSIIIIGGGIAGLSAGCYARMNGYDTRIFEMHDKPGGLCTSWERKGYTFDGCIHWLVGSRQGSNFNRIWRELGAVQGRRIVDHEEFVRLEGRDGKTLIIYTDVDRLEAHMKELAPLDGRPIEQFCGSVRAFSRVDLPTEPPRGLAELARTLPGILRILPHFHRWSKKNVGYLAAGFSDPFLREALSSIFDFRDFPALAMIMTLAWMSARDAGYPLGGSLEFAKAIERRYLELGGKVSYKSRAKRILVKGDRAVGVELEDGTQHRADVVISAADMHATVFDMLDGKYADDEIMKRFRDWPVFKPLVYVTLGVDMDLSGGPRAVSFPLAKPLEITGRDRDRLFYCHYCHDPGLAPPGKSVVMVNFESEYDYWEGLSKDSERYRSEKERIASDVAAALDRRLPGLAERVEVVDVATPMTFVRYTGNWRGSFEGWLLTTRTSKHMIKSLSKTLPGLEGFYMAGQWLQPGGGLPPAAMTAREVVKTICKKDKRRFTTSEP